MVPGQRVPDCFLHRSFHLQQQPTLRHWPADKENDQQAEFVLKRAVLFILTTKRTHHNELRNEPVSGLKTV